VVTRVRLRQARLLVRPLWRTRAWSPVPVAALAVALTVAALRLSGRAVDPGMLGLAAALLLSGAAAFATDDPSAVLVAPLPAPLRFRAGVRTGGAVVAAGCCWAAVLCYIVTTSAAALARPTLAFAVLLAVALLAGECFGGVAGGPAAVGFLLAVARLPDRWTVMDDTRGAGVRLAVLLLLACAGLVLRSRDPATAAP
jgi:hypothetical protein